MCFSAPQGADDATCDEGGRVGGSPACEAEAAQIRLRATIRASGERVNFMAISSKVYVEAGGGLQHRDNDRDVSARRLRVRANLVRAIGDGLSDCRLDPRQAHVEARL